MGVSIIILTIDISNANISAAAMTPEGCRRRFSLSSSKERAVDEYSALFSLIAERKNISPNEIEGGILCSVVPQLTPIICQAVKESFGVSPLVVGPGLKTGLNIRIDDPSELGGDLVASAVAAASAYPLPCVTVEMSAATVLGVIDKNGSHIGCIITPGIMVSQNALANGASQLHHVLPEKPGRIIGKNSAESIKSGLLYGSAAMLDGLLTRIEEELSDTVSAVAYGEWAGFAVPFCRRPGITIDDDLLMRGLYMIYNKNLK
jgi:type III pantothenate kinase